MADNDFFAKCQIARQRARSLKLTQHAIAKAIGASQSQVSRVLSGQAKHYGELAEQICTYVSAYGQGVSRNDVASNDEIIEAVLCVWDGTSHKARLLANLIRAAGALVLPPEPSKGRTPC